MISLDELEKPHPRILITGASGLIGRRLMKQLVPLNPIGVTNTSTKSFGSLTTVAADLTVLAEARRVISTYNPTVVFHLAAESNPTYFVDLTKKPYDEANVRQLTASYITITENLLSTLPRQTHIIFPSTDKVYDGCDRFPSENSALNPLWLRGQLKAECETLISEQLPRHHILRLSMVHDTGHTDSHSFIDQALICLRKKQKMSAYKNIYRCYILHYQLCEFLCSLVGDSNYGIYNVGSSMNSYYSRICQIAAMTNIRIDGLLFPSEGKILPLAQNLNTDKFRTTFGFNLI